MTNHHDFQHICFLNNNNTPGDGNKTGIVGNRDSIFFFLTKARRSKYERPEKNRLAVHFSA